MGLFARSAKVDQLFTDYENRIALIQPLQLGQLTATGHLMAAGWRKNKAKVGFEVKIADSVGRFSVLEARRLFAGHFSILETWNDSPTEMFISKPNTADEDSAAGIAMKDLAATSYGILQPAADGSLKLLASLDEAQQQQLVDWLRSLPKDQS